MSALLLSILMLAGLALLAGGLVLIVRHREWRRGLLMIGAAIVMFGNVAIWAVPVDDGHHTSGTPAGNSSK